MPPTTSQKTKICREDWLDAWCQGARFALEAVSKVDSICFLTDSMKEVCIKLAGDVVIAERDRILIGAGCEPRLSPLSGQSAGVARLAAAAQASQVEDTHTDERLERRRSVSLSAEIANSVSGLAKLEQRSYESMLRVLIIEALSQRLGGPAK